MGNCFGKCLPTHEDICSNFNILPNSSSDLTSFDKVSFCETVGINTNLQSLSNTSVNGSKKRYYFHYYSFENPRMIREVDHQHKWSLNVWGAVSGNDAIGPHFFEGNFDDAAYSNFLQNILPELLAVLFTQIRNEMWFQHEGAPGHYSRPVRDHQFSLGWIGRGGSTRGLLPDLMKQDFFVDLKGIVYDEVPITALNMRKRIKPVLQLVDGLLHHQNNFYSRLKEPSLPSAGSSNSNDIQLHCLDARALLSHTNQSSPTTSLDLEWEHETIPFFMAPDYSDNSCKNMSSESRPESESSTRSIMPMCLNSDCSQPSSANSLEWDSLYPASPPVSEIDTDTQILLGEIERLTKQTLSETGQDYLPS